jgi:LPS-assembly lipoprotein
VSSISWSDGRGRRRGLLAGLAAAALTAGCGFRPLHGPGGEEVGLEDLPAELRREMAAVRIAPMYERTGQIMRRDLQRRFEGQSPGTPGRYLLTVAVRYDSDVLGYRRDGTISRVRIIATADWTLTTQSVPPEPIARSAYPIRIVDAFNVPDLQFFSADVSRDAMDLRLTSFLTQQIAEGVALEFRKRLENRTLPAAPTAAVAGPTPRG